MKRRSFVAALCIAGLVSCGRSLIEDPSFDLWCGDVLCQPWESTGSIRRVKTWHVRDFGVSLADDSSLTQLSTQARVSCVHFEVIADVTASANVRLELDFNDPRVIAAGGDFTRCARASAWPELVR